MSACGRRSVAQMPEGDRIQLRQRRSIDSSPQTPSEWKSQSLPVARRGNGLQKTMTKMDMRPGVRPSTRVPP